jgi:hypothetical protein
MSPELVGVKPNFAFDRKTAVVLDIEISVKPNPQCSHRAPQTLINSPVGP